METALTSVLAESQARRERMLTKRRDSSLNQVFFGANEFTLGNMPSSIGEDGQSALAHNRGEPYAANRPLAQRIAGQTVHVAEVVRAKPNNRGGKSYEPVKSGRRRMSLEEMATMPKWARKKIGLPTLEDKGECVKAIKGMHSDAVRVDILESHPVLALLESPNPRTNGHSFMASSVTSLQFSGKCCWWLTKVEGNRPKVDRAKKFDMWLVPSRRVREKPGNVLLDEGYVILPERGGSSPIEIPADRMIYFYHQDPDDPMYALAPARAAMPAIRVDESIATCQQQTFENGLFPSLAFITGDAIGPDGKNMGKIQYERWQLNQLSARLEQMLRSPSKHGKHIVLDRTISDVKFLSNKPHEMDWLNSNEFNRDRIWRIIGTPRVVSGDVQDANRATALVADEAFCFNSVNPNITLLSQVLNRRLLPLFEDDTESVILWIEEASSTDRDGRLKELTLLLGNRALTVNELRAELGKPSLPDDMGDVLVSTAMQIFEPVTPDVQAGLDERQELLDNEAENDEVIEVENTAANKAFWPFSVKHGETFHRTERRFLVDDPQSVIEQLQSHGDTLDYGVTTIYMDHQVPTWSLGNSNVKFRLRRYDSGDTFFEQKCRSGNTTDKLRTPVQDGANLGNDLIPVGIVTYDRTAYEIADSRVTVDVDVKLNGHALGYAVVEVKGDMPTWLKLPENSERPEFSKSSALLKGRR